MELPNARALVVEKYEMTSERSDIDRIREMRDLFRRLTPLDYYAFDALKKKAVVLVRNLFGDGSDHELGILNARAGPPDYVLPPMDEEQIAIDQQRMWSKGILIVESTMDAAIFELEMPPKRKALSPKRSTNREPARGTSDHQPGSRSAKFSVSGNFNTVIVQSDEVLVRPAPFPTEELRRCYAGHPAALNAVEALDEESRKVSPRASIVVGAIEALKRAGIQIAAGTLERWMTNPSTVAWIHHLLSTAGIISG
jgi:hypothetical protein